MLTWALCYLYVNAIKAMISGEGGKLVFPDYLFIISMGLDVLIVTMIMICTLSIYDRRED